MAQGRTEPDAAVCWFSCSRVGGGYPEGPRIPFHPRRLRAADVGGRKFKGTQVALFKVPLDLANHLGSGGYGIASQLEHLGNMLISFQFFLYSEEKEEQN